MFRGLKLVCALAVAAIFCAGAQELVDNPQYQSWAKHKPGTVVVMKMITDMAGHNMTMTATQTLKEVTPEQATIEIAMSMDMQGQKQTMPSNTMPIKAKVTPEEAKFGDMPEGVKGEIKELGTETITVNGKSYKCNVAEITGEHQGIRTTGKVWRNDDVPGQVVKGEMNFEGAQTGSMKMELVSVDKK